MPEASSPLWLVVLIVGLALVFDYSNGFHDAANSVATIVATRVLRPIYAVIWAALFNFLAAFLMGVKVAATVGKGIVDPAQVTQYVILCGLVGAITWNIITWYFGLPTSSSHALIGGFAGSALARAGTEAIKYQGLSKTLIFIVVAPALGMLLGVTLMTVLSWTLRRQRPRPVEAAFRQLQLVSAALYSLSHGANDAQKTMGIIAASLAAANLLPADYEKDFPMWIVLAAHFAIALGTLSGGWRIVKTMGTRITELRPIGGFSAETAGAITIFLATHLGIPVSTTQTITGAIVGVGATRRLSAVRWGVAGTIVWAWILTIPCSALIAATLYKVLQLAGAN
jgi:inorganic phosphate transporter, PiT family